MSLPHAIETLSGSMFDFDAPSAASISVEDIAVALGNTCRFGGHVKRYYSVAEHAVLVHRLVADAGFPPDVCYAALHHDSQEAYLGDIPTPLKRKIKAAAPGVWEELCYDTDRALCEALGVDPETLHHDAVSAADSLALAYEAAILKPSGRAQRHGAWTEMSSSDVPRWAVWCLPPDAAADEFLNVHYLTLDACG
jgi:hypothetical protein